MDEDVGEMFRENIVHGYLEEEYEMEVGIGTSDYSNLEIEEHLDCYFRFFGKKDMDIIYLYFLNKKRQIDLQEMLCKTQPAISYDVDRIKKQIDVVVRIVEHLDNFIYFISVESKLSLEERKLLLLFFYTTSIVKTAMVLKINHISCRTQLLKAIERLREYGYLSEHDFFNYLFDNLNKVKKTVILK